MEVRSEGNKSTSEMERRKAGYLAGFVSFAANLLLFVLKMWAGLVSNSIALVADAWHTLSDSISSILVIAGTKLASRKPGKRKPFGYGHWEQITAILIGFILGIIGYRFLLKSINGFGDKGIPNYGSVAIIVTAVSILAKEALAQYVFFVGKKTNNASIKADAWHHRSDALSSVIILAGIFLHNFFWWIDSLLGLLVSALIFYAAFGIVKEAILKLLNEPPQEALITMIKKIVSASYEQDLNPHRFQLHNYGNAKELSFYLRFSECITIKGAHHIAAMIKEKIWQQLNIRVNIHIAPQRALAE